jgi:hypothetical protein
MDDVDSVRVQPALDPRIPAADETAMYWLAQLFRRGTVHMVHIAETLGRETDFVRVELYDIAGRIVFGELTNYPGGLWGPNDPPFSPASFDAELGGYWTVPDRYR